MQWRIIAVGKPALPWAKQGIEDYQRRLGRVASVDTIYVKDGTPDQVAERMWSASSGHKVLLDEHGKSFRSLELASWVEKRQLEGCKCVSLLIGGADGHGNAIRAAVKESWSLSSFTLQHELAALVLMEQIYRAHTILRKEPYHRE
ncbi:MAG: 23S rRNA (pseudouridine(1915)-N(3))-methyltransferase RlmH [Verrucomicrobiaceae bacterium]|nr:23S rRNA (pseudouridine(1915)-N(3))-methyltransferase RlmH [Verrucomicrobiaceae bacterium]